ncbi:hypothetical protein ScPMuIL_006548 [Solemya velum]
MGTEILLYVPNIIGYFRLILLIISLVFFHHPLWFLLFYGLSVLLDGFDGYFARRLNQVSDFGAWLDLMVDLISRGSLWCMLYKWGYIVMMLEWTTFVCTHARGKNWKVIEKEKFPTICKLVMAKNFRTVWGAMAIGGVFILPIWLYAYDTHFLHEYLLAPRCVVYAGIALLSAARALAASVEVCFIYFHIQQMLLEKKPKHDTDGILE